MGVFLFVRVIRMSKVDYVFFIFDRFGKRLVEGFRRWWVSGVFFRFLFFDVVVFSLRFRCVFY